MKREALYHKTVDILVQAYFNDTLEHGTCAACAVGNIIAANIGLSVLNDEDGVRWSNGDENPIWFRACNIGIVQIDGYKGVAKRLIDSTGYSLEEVAMIERAFEYSFLIDFKSKDEYVFNSLMAVIDVLDEIHENKDAQVTTSTKSRFSKLPA